MEIGHKPAVNAKYIYLARWQNCSTSCVQFFIQVKLNLSLCVLRCRWHYLEKHNNATITPFNLNFCLRKKSRYSCDSPPPHRFPKVPFSKCFPSTLKRIDRVFKLFWRSVDEAWEGLGWKIDAIYWERRWKKKVLRV